MKLFITIQAYFLLLALPFPIMAASDGREEWEKVLSAGKQEGRLVLYTFPGQELVFQEFQKTFPDINLVEVSVRGSERVTRIVSERRAGKYLADILIGGKNLAQRRCGLTPIVPFDSKIRCWLMSAPAPGIIVDHPIWAARNSSREAQPSIRLKVSSLRDLRSSAESRTLAITQSS